MFEDIYIGKKVLITGDTGFKGSWLAIWLRYLGATVVGYALPPQSSKDNYVVCNLEDKIVHQDGDIRDLGSLKVFFEKHKPEIVFHLAAQPIVLDAYKDPVENFESNVMGTVNVLEAIRVTPSVKIVINVTTDKVYKNIEQIWGYKESDELAGKDPYSASKSCSEIISQSYAYAFLRDSDVRLATARSGNVIGGGDWAADRIIPDYFRAVKENGSLYLRNPDSIRPWLHVLESLSGYLTLGAALYQSDEYCGAWNFGPNVNGKGYSVLELIEAFESNNTIGKIEIVKSEVPQKEKEAILLRLDVTKAAYELNWKPMLNFWETVQYTIEGYMSDINSNDVYQDRLSQIISYMELVKKND